MSKFEQRMRNPMMVVPEALQPLYALGAVSKRGNVPQKTLLLIHLRASQINGCSFCVDMHSRELREAGETDDRLFAVSAWRESPYFNDAERAALALTEAVTRISDRPDAVSDEIWEEVTQHYDEQSLAILIINIAQINFWNRINVSVRQEAGVRFTAENQARSRRNV